MPTKLNVADFTPVDSYLLIEPDFAKTKNILLPDTVKDKNFLPFGTIIKVGPGRPLDSGGREEMGFEPGDRVYVHTWQGVPVEILGKAYICMLRSFVVGKIVDAPPSPGPTLVIPTKGH